MVKNFTFSHCLCNFLFVFLIFNILIDWLVFYTYCSISANILALTF